VSPTSPASNFISLLIDICNFHFLLLDLAVGSHLGCTLRTLQQIYRPRFAGFSLKRRRLYFRFPARHTRPNRFIIP
jgi:hypothetical protein